MEIEKMKEENVTAILPFSLLKFWNIYFLSLISININVHVYHIFYKNWIKLYIHSTLWRDFFHLLLYHAHFPLPAASVLDVVRHIC